MPVVGKSQNRRFDGSQESGALYGMNFSNINIMEHSAVMDSHIPLVVFYPATIEGDQIMFLGKQPASKYRCIVIK